MAIAYQGRITASNVDEAVKVLSRDYPNCKISIGQVGINLFEYTILRWHKKFWGNKEG